MRVLIAGCGIAGMAAALFLERAGHEVVLVERAPHPEPTGSGLLLQPPGMRVLQELGLLERVLALGQPVTRLLGHAENGRRVMDIRYDLWTPGGFGLGLHRAALWRVLHEAVGLANIRLVTGLEVMGLDETAAGVRVRAKAVVDDDANAAGDQSAAALTEERYDLVIAADGSRSRLRAHMGVDRSREYPWGALWANLRQVPDWPVTQLTQRYRRAEEMMGVLPVGRDGSSDTAWATMFWSEPVTELESVRGDVPRWRERALALWPEAAPLIEQVREPEQLRIARYWDVRPARWHQRRVVLIGDAAHGTSPQLGQGATLGLQDAMLLSHALADDANIPNALAAYTRARQKHVHYYQWASWMLTPFFQSHSKMLAGIRDLFFDLAGRAPVTSHEYLATLVGAKSGILFGRLPADLQRPRSDPQP